MNLIIYASRAAMLRLVQPLHPSTWSRQATHGLSLTASAFSSDWTGALFTTASWGTVTAIYPTPTRTSHNRTQTLPIPLESIVIGSSRQLPFVWNVQITVEHGTKTSFRCLSIQCVIQATLISTCLLDWMIPQIRLGVLCDGCQQ